MSKKLKPIVTGNTKYPKFSLKLVGYPKGKNGGIPYIAIIDADNNVVGWIEDKDVKRLKNFCDKALS